MSNDRHPTKGESRRVDRLSKAQHLGENSEASSSKRFELITELIQLAEDTCKDPSPGLLIKHLAEFHMSFDQAV